MFELAKNNYFEKERKDLLNVFRSYKNTFLSDLEDCNSKVCSWEYSLGPTLDMIPYRLLLAGVEGKVIKKLNKRHLKSNRLFSYGLDADKNVLLYKYRMGEECYGDDYRFVNIKDNNKYILHARVLQSSPSFNSLKAICHAYQKANLIYYICIMPYSHWSVRVDKIINKRIINSSFGAYGLTAQIDFDFFYDSSGNLEKIMRNNLFYWDVNSGLSSVYS